MKTLATAVRFAETADADELADIHAAAWRGAYRGIIPLRTLEAMVRRRGPDWWDRAARRQAAVLVAEFGGRPVGYATPGRNRTSAIAADGEIYEIYLRPEYQGVGLGGRLFGAARDLLAERGLRGLAVRALADNGQAVDFYRALGGREVAEGAETFAGVALRKIAFRWS